MISSLFTVSIGVSSSDICNSFTQVEDPSGNRQYHRQGVSSEDYSFTANRDGKYLYCFSNEGWSSNSKEVAFNVHGIVYVPETEMAQDPLEVEGMIVATSPS
jgi:hypothetical protein